MEERKIVQFKKDELKVKEYIKRSLGKGKISNVRIEYTPIGEKIIVSTNKPGLVIGRRGEKIDEIALGLEKLGPIKFKIIAYKTLQRIIDAGALGVEIRMSGKLPSSRAKSWRFAYGYLKKTGDSAKIVDRAKSTAQTKPGTVGIKVSILSPGMKMTDKITIDEELLNQLRINSVADEESLKPIIKKSPKKKTVKGGKL